MPRRVTCPLCSESFSAQGIINHIKSRHEQDDQSFSEVSLPSKLSSIKRGNSKNPVSTGEQISVTLVRKLFASFSYLKEVIFFLSFINKGDSKKMTFFKCAFSMFVFLMIIGTLQYYNMSQNSKDALTKKTHFSFVVLRFGFGTTVDTTFWLWNKVTGICFEVFYLVRTVLIFLCS